MSWSSGRVTVHFGDFEFDTAAYELRRNGRRVRLARQPMDVLLALLERPGELISRHDIRTRLWPEGVFVDVDAGIHTAILKIRQVLSDSFESPKFVETVVGKGYRFIAPVHTEQRSPAKLLEVAAAGAERGALAARHNLPAELTSFVGRTTELRELPLLLASTRLLMLTGTGGVGKTRLALRLASDLVNQFSAGVWLVDLAPLSTPDLVLPTIASTLGIREGGSRPLRTALLENLRDRAMLLVLDNCEHLVQACAELAASLLRGAPALRILATSREPLGVAGETVFRVPSLSLPDGSKAGAEVEGASEATRLFVERARAIQSGFAAGPDGAAAISRICRRLDGIPLAIELAAARVVVLSPAQIEARLDDRFRLFTGNLRTVLPRQRTLEAALEWSYQLLEKVERRLLTRLSVFAGSWTLEAAEYVCAGGDIRDRDMLDLLLALVNKSLVAVECEPGNDSRYHLLETVRLYALERLTEGGGVDELRQRHFEFFFNEFHGGQRTFRSHGQGALMRRVLLDQENIRAALEWALPPTAGSARGVELAAALFWFWTKRGQFEEGRRWLERALAAADPGVPALRARIIIGLAHMYYFQGQYAEAGGAVGEALAIGRESGDDWVAAFALFLQALAAFEQGDLDAAETLALASTRAASTSGDPWQHGGPLLVRGSVAVARGQYHEALRLFDESIDVHRRMGDSWGLSILLAAGGGLRVMLGMSEQARLQAAEAMSIAVELDDLRGIAWGLEVFSALATDSGRPGEGATLWGAADAMLARVGSSLGPTIRWIRERYVDVARASLGTEMFGRLYHEGRAVGVSQALAIASRVGL